MPSQPAREQVLPELKKSRILDSELALGAPNHCVDIGAAYPDLHLLEIIFRQRGGFDLGDKRRKAVDVRS